MINKIKKNKYQIIELIIIFIVTLLFNLTRKNMSYDEVWNYGFSYNILTGLTPYKDFNMVITPLYPLLATLYMMIFGSSFLSYYALGSLVSTGIFYFIKKQVPKCYYLVYVFFLAISMPGYNLFTLLLFYIILTLEEKNKNDYLIGLFLGLTFLTKQNIGIYLCLPTIFIKDIKRIFKRIIGFIIPCIILIIYLLYNNSLYEFIDYTFLGIGDFAQNNTNLDLKFIIIFLVTIIFLIYKYIKTKDIKVIYLICYQLMAYPLFDLYHTILPIIPTIGYFIKKININKKIVTLGFATYCLMVFLGNTLIIMKEDYLYPNDTNVYKYGILEN